MIKLTETNLADVIEENELLIVDFWAEWCVPCKKFAPVMDELDAEIAEEDEIAVCKVNVDEEPDIAVAFNISTIPAVLFIKDGEEAARLVGIQKKEALLDIIKEIM